MGQLKNVLLTIDKAHTVPQRALDCGPSVGGFKPSLWAQPYGRNQIYRK